MVEQGIHLLHAATCFMSSYYLAIHAEGDIFQIAAHVPWSLCIKENAELNLPDTQIWRNCYQYAK